MIENEPIVNSDKITEKEQSMIDKWLKKNQPSTKFEEEKLVWHTEQKMSRKKKKKAK